MAWDLAPVIVKDDSGYYDGGRLPAKTCLNFHLAGSVMSKCPEKAGSK